MLNYPCFPIEGNHDDEIKRKGIKLDELSRTGIIEFNGTRIICFNAVEVYPPDEPLHEDRGDIPDDVIAWLEEAMRDSYEKGYITMLANHYELANDPNDYKWNESIRRNREELIALCEQYGVRLYLNGHEHISNLIHKVVKKANDSDADILDVEFGRTAITYSVLDIKNDGFYFSQYKAETNALVATLFVPLQGELSNIVYTEYETIVSDVQEVRRNWN